MQCEKLEDYCA